jgi:hypothetical protein
MQVIRTFDNSIAPIAYKNLVKFDKFWTTKDRKNAAEILLPILHPRLADSWMGFELNGFGKMSAAITSTGDNWFYFTNGRWEESEFPVFATPAEIRAGISKWAGAIQFLVKIEPNSLFKELKVGYCVRQDIVEYLLETALPQKLKTPIAFSQNVAINSDGYSTPFPQGFDGSALTDVKFQLFNQLPVSATPVPELGNIQLSEKLTGGAIGQLLFSVCPSVEFSQYLYQISTVPCVVIREIEEGVHHRPQWEDAIQVSENESIKVPLVYGSDRAIEISCIASKEGEARQVAIGLMSLIQQSGSVYSPPHDLAIGLQVVGSLKKGTQNYIKSGSLPTMSFKVLMRNISN